MNLSVRQVGAFSRMHTARGGVKPCPCDTLQARAGALGVIDTVDDMPNWTAWFGSWAFVALMHQAIKARLASTDEAGVPK